MIWHGSTLSTGRSLDWSEAISPFRSSGVGTAGIAPASGKRCPPPPAALPRREVRGLPGGDYGLCERRELARRCLPLALSTNGRLRCRSK
jgi:hypothetical protein